MLDNQQSIYPIGASNQPSSPIPNNVLYPTNNNIFGRNVDIDLQINSLYTTSFDCINHGYDLTMPFTINIS